LGQGSCTSFAAGGNGGPATGLNQWMAQKNGIDSPARAPELAWGKSLASGL